jgi:hypothetical protein
MHLIKITLALLAIAGLNFSCCLARPLAPIQIRDVGPSYDPPYRPPCDPRPPRPPPLPPPPPPPSRSLPNRPLTPSLTAVKQPKRSGWKHTLMQIILSCGSLISEMFWRWPKFTIMKVQPKYIGRHTFCFTQIYSIGVRHRKLGYREALLAVITLNEIPCAKWKQAYCLRSACCFTKTLPTACEVNSRAPAA